MGGSPDAGGKSILSSRSRDLAGNHLPQLNPTMLALENAHL